MHLALNQSPMMGSSEISRLASKDHKHVLRDIRIQLLTVAGLRGQHQAARGLQLEHRP